MIKIYIWRTSFGNGHSNSSSFRNNFVDWGHVAIEIPDPINGSSCPQHYMSYWPPEKKSEKCSYYYEDDRQSCGDAHEIIEITNLNKTSMIETWNKELNMDFHDTNHNCCTVAAKILKSGYEGSNFSGVSAYFGRVWKRVINFDEVIWRNAVNRMSEITIWTPDRIEEYSLHIKKIFE